MAENAYIHIPFCKSKCKYCSFVSYTEIQLKEKYINALEKEIRHYYKKEPLKTLYIGGGTPSLMSISEIAGMLDLFVFDKTAEITIELNPETLSEQYLKDLITLGVNRVSLGCQTFGDDILKLIGRRHTSQQAINAVNFAQQAGFKNISLDFIYGLPEQTLNGFMTDLKKAVDLDITHISLYGLKIDEGCYYYKHRAENTADDDLQADMYIAAAEYLTNHGFNHYEISNFAKQGFDSKHNINYWNNNSYYGFGLAAHGFDNEKRYYNTDILEVYINAPCRHKHETLLSESEHLEEEIFLGFRRVSGINVENINIKYSIDFEKKYGEVLKKYSHSGHILKTSCGFRLSMKGILVSNLILSEFI